MSPTASAAAWRVPLAPFPRLVLLAMIQGTDKIGKCVLSVKELVGLTQLSDKTVRRAIDALEAASVVITDGKNGQRPAYLMCLDGLPSEAPLAAQEATRKRSTLVTQTMVPPTTLAPQTRVLGTATLTSFPEEGSKGTPLSSPRSVEVTALPGWDLFWAAYPRRVAKPAAVKAYTAALRKGVAPAVIMATLKAHRFSDKVQYIPYPASWLNQAHWEDELPDADLPGYYNGQPITAYNRPPPGPVNGAL